jgi:nucleoid-associated protein YgaU
MGNQDNKPGLFDSRRVVREQAAKMPPAAKADFSGVSSQVSATVDETGAYMVAAGDSLSSIARAVYGDANAWERIFAANRDQLTDPDEIKPGQMLNIPPRP